MKYFIFLNKQQLGPFEEADLLSKGIDESTKVWCQGMPKWLPAGQVPALSYLFQHDDVDEGANEQLPQQSTTMAPGMSSLLGKTVSFIGKKTKQTITGEDPVMRSRTTGLLNKAVPKPMSFFAGKVLKGENDKLKSRSSSLLKKMTDKVAPDIVSEETMNRAVGTAVDFLKDTFVKKK